jgi:hypothetical protein
LCETGHCGKLFNEQFYDDINYALELWKDWWPEIGQWVQPPQKFITVNDELTLLDYQLWADKDGWETGNLDPSWVPDIALYKTSFCSVVVETSPENKFVNISEKTIRPLCLGHLIIFIGAPGTVAFLRKLGFDMFDDIIDHNYDTIVDPFKRMKEALNSIKKLNQLSVNEMSMIRQQIQKRRQFNQDLVAQMHDNINLAQIKIFDNIKEIIKF